MSISNEDIERLLGEGIADARVHVQGGGGKYLVEVVSDSFAGLNAVKRQQAVYRLLKQHIGSGEIHAVTMELYTSAEAPARGSA